jgi:hypothetical protein
MKRTVLTVKVYYDDKVTDAESVAVAADRLLETALSTPGILDEYGNPEFGEFLVEDGQGFKFAQGRKRQGPRHRAGGRHSRPHG